VTLSAPNLDDRGFQDLVDEAKRMVQQRCPEWTDHNVADPGVTLIEAFAQMVDQLIYRLNRMPDLNYVKFLEMLGEQQRPPTAAQTRLRFQLTVPQPQPLIIPRGTAVSTARHGQELPVTFTTRADLVVVSIDRTHVLTQENARKMVSRDGEIALKEPFFAFADSPSPGDCLYIGLSVPAPHCIVRLDVVASIQGIGVDPLRPPRVVEAWDGSSWVAAVILEDSTGGLNRPGRIDILIDEHASSVLDEVSAAWIRLRIIEPADGRPPYTASPQVASLKASCVGGEVPAGHAALARGEVVGTSEGTPGQRFPLSQTPLVAEQPALSVRTSSPDGWVTWHRVSDFSQSGPDDLHFRVDGISGFLYFGPSVRLEDGGIVMYGAVPPLGATIEVSDYLVGGGSAGNVSAGTLTVLKSSLPFVSKVTNPRAATGGVDAESIDEMKTRAAISIKTRDRAVTGRDIELLVRKAAPAIARVRCVDANEFGHAGTALVLVVPEVGAGPVDFETLQPDRISLDAIAAYLEPRRVLGMDLRVEPPRYLGVSVAALVRQAPGYPTSRVMQACNAAITDFLHPTRGGFEGTGWPFGRPLLAGDIHARLHDVAGVAYVEAVRLIPEDAVTGERGEPTDRVQPGPLELLLSGRHSVKVAE
jgi:predicted phage baseplate assembly protein